MNSIPESWAEIVILEKAISLQARWKIGFVFARTKRLRHDLKLCRVKDNRNRLVRGGRKNIQHTVRYTELAPDRFEDFWR